MERDVYLNYFEKSFINTVQPSPDNPVLIIYDGHSSHIDLKVIEIAINNNVTILLLPPQTTETVYNCKIHDGPNTCYQTNNRKES